MTKSRLEAFSDGVIAIIITIMVLELRVPHGAEFSDLKSILPVFASYVMSFILLGIYWVNHHHLLHAIHHVSAGILWANLHLLFWLSLAPFTTAWMGENDFTGNTVALYCMNQLLAALSYYVLIVQIVKVHGKNSVIGKAVGKAWKGKISSLMYMAAIGLSFVNRWVAIGLVIFVALMWLVPDRRIEKALREAEKR